MDRSHLKLPPNVDVRLLDGNIYLHKKFPVNEEWVNKLLVEDNYLVGLLRFHKNKVRNHIDVFLNKAHLLISILSNVIYNLNHNM